MLWDELRELLTERHDHCGICKRVRTLRIEDGSAGAICDSCADLLTRRTSGVVPTAYEDGRTIRMRRPGSNRL